jgi:transposase
MITDIEAKRFVEVLSDRKKATVARYLEHLPDKERIQVAVIDMHQPISKPYRSNCHRYSWQLTASMSSNC